MRPRSWRGSSRRKSRDAAPTVADTGDMKAKLQRPLPGVFVHLVGVGGAGMAALAELLHGLGYRVSGSDLKASRITDRLAELGVRIVVGPHRAEHVDGAEHVVVSAAVPEGNPELVRARELGVDTMSRAELLGRLFEAGRGVAVAGTHGKTTTASMLAWALEAAGLGPSFVIGGDLNDVGTGARLGNGDLLVAEADEAYGSFLYLHSALTVVTNVDRDHLDHYADQEAIDDAFCRFLDQRRDGGVAVVCAEDPGVERILHRVRPPVVTYGFRDADLVLEPDQGGWRVRWQGEVLGSIEPRMPGRHNALNAGGAVAAARMLGAGAEETLGALSAFSGVERRLSVRGREGGIVVIDDYAHNPGKVAASLRAVREAYPQGRVVALFQPHLYSRTRQLADEFGTAFEDADVVVVTDVYGAREEPLPGVSGRLLSDAIRVRSPRRTVPTYVPRLDDAAGFVAGLVESGDIVVTLGAGDVTSAAPRILELLRETGASPSVP